jgi:hypothetical protein
LAQTLVNKIQTRKSRLRVNGLKVKDREKIKEAIAISIQNGNYTTRDIGVDVGKDHSTISRYLTEMERKVHGESSVISTAILSYLSKNS